MWRALEAVVVRQLAGSVRATVEDSLDRARQIGVALVVAQAGLVCGLFGVGFLLASLFFYLSNQTAYVQPAYLTGLIGLVPTLGCLFAAGRLFRR